MPTLFVMMKVHGTRELALALDARDICCDKTFAVVAGRDCPQCGQNGRRWVAAKRIAAVVVIERMRGDAVNEGRAEYVERLAVAEDQCRPRCRGLAQGTRYDCSGVLLCARERDTDSIENPLLRHFDGCARQRIVSHV